MKYFITLLLGCSLLSCKMNSSKTKKETATNTTTENIFYVGTYTKKDSKGIYKYSLSKEGKLSKIGLVATVVNPTFLVKSNDKKSLFAVGETDKNGTGFIRSFKIEKDSLIVISKEKTGGAGPCFVGINNDNYIVTANYRGGTVGLLKTDKQGKLTELLDVQKHTGKGTTKRQEGPHAHSAWFHPTKKEIISLDLGTNELWFSKIENNKLVLKEQQKLAMPEGSGPRHLTFHPNKKWMYVLNELSNTVSLVKEKEGVYFVENSISTLPTSFTAFSKSADIHISKDGKFLYASNRGHQSIAIFEVNPENGALKIVGYENVLGEHPRNFSFSPDEDFLIVANQKTDNIISFKRDKTSGKLTFVDEISAPMPVCILF